MGQAQATVSRRAIRRAFGPAATELLANHEQTLAILQNAIETTQRQLDALSRSTIRQLGLQTEALSDEVESRQAFQDQTFWQRLCWLFGL